MEHDLIDFPQFFISRGEGQSFYRPLSRETYNLLMYKLFGLNALAYHLMNLLLIILNLFLLAFVIKKITSKNLAMFFSVLIFIISAIHSIEIYYLASIQTLISTFFALISILFFTNYIIKTNINYFLASILFYSLALFSHESAIILPGILFVIYYFLKREYKKLFLLMMPFAMVGLLFFLSTSSITNLPSQEVYKPAFQSNKMFNTLGWYILWSFGMPEMLVDFVGPQLAIKSEFTRWYGYYAKVVFPLLFSIVSLLFLIILSLKKIIFTRLLIISISSFFISISPFLFFPQHKFVYYLSFSSIWFSAAVGSIVATGWRQGIVYKFFTLLIILFFFTISYQTMKLNTITYWAAKRAAAAKVILQDLKRFHPEVDTNTIFYIVDDPNYPDIGSEWGTSSKQAFYILSGSDALKLLYNDPTIETYYQWIGGLPESIDKKKVITFTAKFPY